MYHFLLEYQNIIFTEKALLLLNKQGFFSNQFFILTLFQIVYACKFFVSHS